MALRAALLSALLVACTGGGGLTDATDPDDDTDVDTSTPDPLARYAPATARMHRLTEHEWRTSVSQLLHVQVGANLPGDYRLHGFTSVGAAELSIASSDLDLYEAAAWAAAEAALPDTPSLHERVGCDLTVLAEPEVCIAPFAADLARQAWRRPIDSHEVDDLVALYAEVVDLTGSRVTGGQAVVAAVLQSPWFLFRVEIGVPDGADPAIRHLTDHELAARLSSFLTGGPPDQALLADADEGLLTDPEVLRAHALRLLDGDGARDALARFVDEWLDLERLATVDKDVDRFPELTPSLRAAMRAELQALFVDVVLTRDEDVRATLTSERAWVTPELADLYGRRGLTEPGWIDLPAHQERGGVLGRAGYLALHAHNSATSPTKRGLFVRTRMLCGVVHPPPQGVDTTLPPVDTSRPTTLRERLTQHADDPNCSGCHNAMDPIGLALEHYDPVGRHRTHEWGLPIDASFSIAEGSGAGAAELGAVVAEDPKFTRCLVRQLYRHAVGQHEYDEEERAIEELVTILEGKDHRLKAFLVELVLHDAFRQVAPPDRETCASEGASRPCATACGEGTQSCVDGHWRDCSAATAIPETCNGLDDDCDGEVDEVVRTCEGGFGPGLQLCTAGAWEEACASPPAPPEVCNGLDDDKDGEVDEGLDIDLMEATWGQVAAGHGACSVAIDGASGACKAAIKRTCAASPCAVTGFGPVGLDYDDGTATLACLNGEHALNHSTTYTELAARHPGCDGASGRRWGSDCNAAIHRWCAARGEASGYGPVENSGDAAYVVCTPKARVKGLKYSEIVSFSDPDLGPCDGTTWRLGPACDAAIHGWCRSQGFETGHGPVENYYDDLVVSCLGTLEDR